MRSFSLLRANPVLSTNLKIVVDSDYKLYMESFSSNEYLSDIRFKKFEFKRSDTYDQLVPTFFKKVPSEIAFFVKYSEDNQIQYDDFSKQYDDIYTMGCSNIDDLDYEEEFECLAPLHFNPDNLPEYFYIFRVDKPGLIDLNKDNFRSEILEKFKCVTYFDLTKKSKLGEWINNSFVDNREFPISPINFDVRDSEFTQWNGIDYDSGGYAQKSFFINDILDRDTPFFEFDKFLTNGFKDNKVVYPNILNLKFLFDDTPATPTQLRKWSINRYYGFYINKREKVNTVTPYSPKKLHNDVKIIDNNIIDSRFDDPFIKGFAENSTFIEYKGEFYEVIEIRDNTYKIISSYNLKGKEDIINTQVITIDESNYISYNKDFNDNIFSIDGFNKADVWVIDINGKFHNIIKDDNGYKIYTDYAFSIIDNVLEYWINRGDDSYLTTVDLSLVDSDNKPMNFNIFKLNFTDIMDFDTDIVNTNWSNIEYDKRDEIVETMETKMYSENLNSGTNPLEFDEFVYRNKLSKIPTSSEYSATQEIFEIKNPNNDFLINLSDIWRKNPIFCKWGYDRSLDMRDYPYRLNNSKFGENYNRSSNTYKDTVDRSERNLDHFYTINPDSNEYDYHSLHITDYNEDKSINKDFKFDLSKYFNIEEDYYGNYFNYIFTKKEYFIDNTKNTKKYSTFIKGDDDNTNETLFRGIKFRLYELGKTITTNDIFGNIDIKSMSILPTEEFNDWKFSIIFTELSHDLDSPEFIERGGSNLEWLIIDNWEVDETYATSSVVLYSDVLFTNPNGSSLIEDPNDRPGLSNDWVIYEDMDTCFRNPTKTQNWIYYFDEYYYMNTNTGAYVDIWNPSKVYERYVEDVQNTVIYNNKVYRSITNNNTSLPTDNKKWVESKEESYSDLMWIVVELWNSNKIYTELDYVVREDKLYRSTISNNLNSDPISTGNNWIIVNNIKTDTDRIYDTTRNLNVVELNDKYYLCKGNPNSETLENGINIYINKKWNNVLLNYYCNDNTYFDKVSNINRDDIYNEIFDKMTSYNLIDSLSNIDTLNGFSDFIKYYIIEEDGTYKKYDITNVNEMPYLLTGVGADEYTMYVDSLQSKISTVNRNLYNPKSLLKKSTLNDFTEVNFYNDKNLGISFEKTRVYNGFNLNTKRYMNEIDFYRFNGNYFPIFNEISLFKKPDIDNVTIDIDNYIFDNTLSSFGLINERVISKVNINKDLLKFKDSNELKSIYPMIDEFGYTTISQFIFKSTWDFKYLMNFNEKSNESIIDYNKNDND